MRISRILLALVAATVATACGGDSNAPDSYLGRYALISVDGAPLPLKLIDQPSLTITVRDGALTLSTRSSYTGSLTVLVVVDGEALPPEPRSCSGSYQRSGNTFTFTSVAGGACSGVAGTGTLDGKTLTVEYEDGQTLVFRR